LTNCGSSLAHPSQKDIAIALAGVPGVADVNHYFVSTGKPVTISDGGGSSLTAVIGTPHGSADGGGQRIFFFHGTSYVFVTDVSEHIDKIWSPATGGIAAAFAQYAAHDPFCCPSLSPAVVTYHWNGAGVEPNRPLPVQPAVTPPDCMVGVTETSTVFEFRGWNAAAFCDHLMTTSQNVYRYHGSPLAPVACQYAIPDKLFGSTIATLYEEPGGGATLNGEDACTRLRILSSDALPALTPTPST
jgi:hypothetical protein